MVITIPRRGIISGSNPGWTTLDCLHQSCLKLLAISAMINKYGWNKILSEIEKCDVRCANCHKRRTARQFNWSKLGWYEQGREAE